MKNFKFVHFLVEHIPTVADEDLHKIIVKALAQGKLKFINEVLKSLFYSKFNLNALISGILTNQKFNLILELISFGVEVRANDIVKALRKGDIQSEREIISYLKSTSEGCSQLFFKALNYSEFDFAASLLNGDDNTLSISLSAVLKFSTHEAKKCYVTFIKTLLDRGMDPNGGDESNTLDIVLDFSRDRKNEQIQLLTLLLQYNAAIEQCTYQRKHQTTLLHIATQFATDLGNYYNN